MPLHGTGGGGGGGDREGAAAAAVVVVNVSFVQVYKELSRIIRK